MSHLQPSPTETDSGVDLPKNPTKTNMPAQKANNNKTPQNLTRKQKKRLNKKLRKTNEEVAKVVVEQKKTDDFNENKHYQKWIQLNRERAEMNERLRLLEEMQERHERQVQCVVESVAVAQPEAHDQSVSFTREDEIRQDIRESELKELFSMYNDLKVKFETCLKEKVMCEQELEEWKEHIGEIEQEASAVEKKATKKVEKVEKILVDVQQVNVKLKEELRMVREEKETIERQLVDLSHLNNQKDLTIHKLRQRLAAYQPKHLSVGMKFTLKELQSELNRLKIENLPEKARARLAMIPTKEAVKQMTFFAEHEAYEKAIKANIEKILGNVNITRADLLKIPKRPVLPELDEQE